MNKQFWKAIKLAIIITGLIGGQVAAQTSSSPNYQTNEYMFGTGGELDTTSANYRAQSSVGALGVGSSASANYDAEAGFLTPADPFLEMVVTEQTVDLGNLSDTAYSSGAAQGGGCSCSFNVRTYLTSAYVVLTVSDPPTSENGDILDAKTVLGAPSSDPSVEEFGINLVDNANPNIGANSVNIPDNTFADGTVETGYNTPDQFKYNVGDIVAKSPATAGNQAVGQTNFTISYIAKRKTLSDAGVYTMNHVLVVVATY
jgi:hypothetical protein